MKKTKKKLKWHTLKDTFSKVSKDPKFKKAYKDEKKRLKGVRGKETKLQELERRIEALERLQQPSFAYVTTTNLSSAHYHQSGTPCFKNPCYWAGT